MSSTIEKPTSTGHQHVGGILGFIGEVLHLPGLGHDHADEESIVTDQAVLDSSLGIATVWVALGLLWLTTVIQAVIYLRSNSVALLADTGHNLVDAMNSIPLLIALYLGRRVATRRFTHGYGRAEDIAGIFIVLSIVYSAGHILVESINRFFNPFPLQNLGLIAIAAIVGFIGNEGVAILQIRVGKKIGSDAMIADGQHARVDGITSLAVLFAVFGSWIGIPILDPIIGVLIAIAIIGIAFDAIKKVWYRLMDAVDPTIVNRVEHFASQAEGVNQITRLRVRWIGHRLQAQLHVAADETLSMVEAYRVATNVEDILKQAIPQMSEAIVQVEPQYLHENNNCLPNNGKNTSTILPPRYQSSVPSAAPMGAAGLVFDDEGNAAWNEIWTDFCDLALAGGPPHRGSLLEPIDPAKVEANPEGYAYTLQELERGIRMVTGLPVVQSENPGWIGMECESEEMALWLLRAIVVENVSVRREKNILFFPAGPDFKLEKEIKNVVTIVAKTNHYWARAFGSNGLITEGHLLQKHAVGCAIR